MKANFKNTEAVSPVVGVMLMLVVTIIIAAVVSAFAGGMAANQQKAPTGDFECKIANTGSWGTSYFDLNVLAVSEPIPTKDVKLTTSWKASDGTTGGSEITGPAKGEPNTHYGTTAPYHAPLGFGPEIEGWKSSGSSFPVNQYYGNYSMLAGTRLHNTPTGYSSSYGGYGVTLDKRYEYIDGTGYTCSTDVDAVQAILGENWYHLKVGDTVNVKLTHVPTGVVIFEKDVPVEG